MSSDVSELNPEVNKFERLFQAMGGQAIAIAIAGASFLGMLMCVVMVAMNSDDAKDAKALVQVELRATRDEIRDLKDEIARTKTSVTNDKKLTNVYINELHSDLKAHGFEPPPPPEN